MLIRYILKRILIMIPTLIVTSALIFTVINLPEGDYFETLAAEMQAQGEKADMSRAELAEYYGWSISDEIDARREARESRYYAPGDPDAPEGD